MKDLANNEENRIALKWATGNDKGLSSMAICRHMLYGDAGIADFPYDPADIGRCFRLLEKIPQWEKRIKEMAVYGPQWSALSENWLIIKKTMQNEVGIDWSKGDKAPKTYALIKTVLEQVK